MSRGRPPGRVAPAPVVRTIAAVIEVDADRSRSSWGPRSTASPTELGRLMDNVVVIVEDGRPGRPARPLRGRAPHGPGRLVRPGADDARPHHDLPPADLRTVLDSEQVVEQVTHHRRPRGGPPFRHRRPPPDRAGLGLTRARRLGSLPGGPSGAPPPAGIRCARAVPEEAAERPRGHRPRPPPPLVVLRAAAVRADRLGRPRPGLVLSATDGRVDAGPRRHRHPGLPGLVRPALLALDHHQLRGHHRPADLPPRRAGQARHRDPARPGQHRVLPPVDLRAHGRARATWSSSPPARPGRQAFSNVRNPSPCRTRSTGRSRPTRTASSTGSGAVGAGHAGRRARRPRLDPRPDPRARRAAQAGPRSPRRSSRRRSSSSSTGCEPRPPGHGRQPGPLGHRDPAGLGRHAGGLHAVLRAARPAARGRHQGPRRRGHRRPRARPGGAVRRGEPARGRRGLGRRGRRHRVAVDRRVADVGPALRMLAALVGAERRGRRPRRSTGRRAPSRRRGRRSAEPARRCGRSCRSGSGRG